MKGQVRSVDLGNSHALYFAPGTVSPVGETVHVSGQVGALTSGKVPACYESQIHLALLNLRKVLIVAGASVSDITKLTLYIVNYDPQRRIHTKHIQKFLAGHRPAITLVPVAQLASPEWLFEVDAVALKTAKPKLTAGLHSIVDIKNKVDVIVVGAGLSGLASAREVTRAGLSCLVLEARDRVGGKTWSSKLPSSDAIVDLGAAWINDTNQGRVYALAKEFGVDLIEQNTSGSCVLQDFDGQCSTFVYGEVPKFAEEERIHLALIRDMCEAECQKIDPARPRDESLDSVTFETFLRQQGASRAALTTAAVWTRAMLGQEPSDISALYFLTYCKAGGGLLQMRSDRKDGGQYLRVKHGTQSFSTGLAKTLPEGTIKFSTIVQGVDQKAANHVEVRTSQGTYVCQRLIMSLPGPVYKTIDFNPALPLAKTLLYEQYTYGYYTKVMMVFSKAFWIERGFCGLAQSFVGPASVIRDTSVPADKKWVLTCFLAGEPGRAWAKQSEKERESQLIAQIGQLFNSETDAKATFIESMGHEWINEEFSGWGCPCTALPPGVLDTVGDVLTEPFGRIHFVGTETASQWKGYMEGALATGERGGTEVIDKICNVRAQL